MMKVEFFIKVTTSSTNFLHENVMARTSHHMSQVPPCNLQYFVKYFSDINQTFIMVKLP